jgi:hypothetical protein
MPDESMNVATGDDHGHRMRTLPTPWLGMVVVPAGVRTLRGRTSMRGFAFRRSG